MAPKRPATTSTAQPVTSPPRRADAERQRRHLLTILGAAVVAAVAVAVVLIVLNSRQDAEVTGNTVDAGNGLRAPANEIDNGVARDGRVLGDPAAPVVVVEYADYQCPFCTGFGLTGLPQLLDDYVATGQVRLEYAHFVVIGGDDPDGESYRAAEAAQCADDQGKFWEMHELLVANSLGEFRGSFTPERLKQIAALVDGLDRTAFGSCVDARTHQDEVVQMSTAGRAAGIRSTPTFIVNGQPVSGGYASLKGAIDEQLAGS